MGRSILLLALSALVVSSLACTITIPGIRLPSLGHRLEVGPMQEFDEQVPRDGTSEARVEIRLGAGEIRLGAGDPDPLFAGHFRTNVVQWAPEVTWQDGLLRVSQGEASGIPDPGARNEWDIRFSPLVPMEMDLEMGGSRGDLDFTGLPLRRLRLEAGASDLVIHFDVPNPAQMESLKVRAGAANLRMEGIGNAGPQEMRVEGGVGNMILDFSGNWPESAQVTVVAGAGSLTLRVPRHIGVRVELEGGLSNLQVDPQLALSEGAYINSAYSQTDRHLLITLRVGMGSVAVELAGES